MTVLDAHRAFSIVASACLAPITAHPDTHPERDAERYRAAAVLLPIVAGRRSLDLLFTVRAQHLKVHPGQISFPGGHVEREDADVAATAVRETHEEVGIAPATVRILGCLPPCTTGSGYRVVPVVGLIPSGLVYRIDPYEVEAAFHVPLAHLLAPENRRRERKHNNGRLRSYHVIDYGRRHIWGATASMVINLAAALERSTEFETLRPFVQMTNCALT